MRTSKQFRDIAWDRLTGRYWWAVLVALVAALLGGTQYAPGFSFSGADVDSWQRFFSPWIDANVLALLAQALKSTIAPVAAITSVASLAHFIVGGAAELGYSLYALELCKSPGTPRFETLFARFSIFGRALGLRLLMWIKIFLWTLLLIIPGIVAAYRYAMAPFILAEHPELTAGEAISRSSELMRGNKWRLFCLYLSFIGWMLLVMLVPLTLGLLGRGTLLRLIPVGLSGVLLSPYILTAAAAFYLEITQRLPGDGATTSDAARAACAEALPDGSDPSAEGGEPEWV